MLDERVLITGGRGFLGRALITALQAQGAGVVALDVAASPTDLQSGVIFEQGDIRDPSVVSNVVGRHDISAIVHLAALVIPACRENPVLGAEVDMIGHINVLEAARRHGVANVVYTSSVAAHPREPLNSPVNLYGVYKRCCEDISKVYFLDHGIASIGLRPNVVYGPGRDVGETAAITQAMRAAAEGRQYEMPFSGQMCFQHVDEVTDIFLRCLTTVPDRPVVTDLTTETASTDDVIAAIHAVVPDAQIAPSNNHRPAPPSLDNSALRDLLKQWDRVSLAEGTRRTIAHYKGIADAC
ncbi:Nucleoside-diphosphate-sugar epimerase [Salinihabitans flavidus]|uniref:Nucleoside-diphosphate-sugar epimerase n=1 Tax=Salinihabitans flavidus TaxID=569882 RepID=A0A1H8UA64_9RHOB|nr:NAD(P)-dependent oxidoreductase [Salinihabitans flavidus]SEO99986.1 Nucleoside-diphosphate-sugar epimerase [Salinihabitans flavidus]